MFLTRITSRWITVVGALMLLPVTLSAQTQDITCDSTLTAQDPVSAYIARATACLEPVGQFLERNTEQAIADTTFVIEQDSTNAEAFALRGQARFWQQQFGQSIADFTVAGVLQPEKGSWLSWRSWAMIQVDDLDGAIADLTTLLAIEPENEIVLLERSRVYERAGNMEAALADAEAATLPEGATSDAFRRLGDLHYEMGDDEAALTAYEGYLERATERNPVVETRIMLINQRLGR